MSTLVRRQPCRNLARASRRARRLASLGVGAGSVLRTTAIATAGALVTAALASAASRSSAAADASHFAACTTRDGAPAEPAVTSLVTASRSELRTVRRSIAAAAPIRRVPRRRSSDLSYSMNQTIRPPGAALGFTPHASMMQACQGTHYPILSGTFAVSRGPVVVGPSAMRTPCADRHRPDPGSPRLSPAHCARHARTTLPHCVRHARIAATPCAAMRRIMGPPTAPPESISLPSLDDPVTHRGMR